MDVPEAFLIYLFMLEYNSFTICVRFCYATSWISCMYTHTPSLLSLQVIVEHKLSSWWNMYVSRLLSPFAPPLLSPLCPQVHSWYLDLHSCPSNMFVRTIFLDLMHTLFTDSVFCSYLCFSADKSCQWKVLSETRSPDFSFLFPLLRRQPGAREDVFGPPKWVSLYSICCLLSFALVECEWIWFIQRWFLLVWCVDLTFLEGNKLSTMCLGFHSTEHILETAGNRGSAFGLFYPVCFAISIFGTWSSP